MMAEVQAATALEVRPVRSRGEMDAVYRMVHDAYVEMGYCEQQRDGKFKHHPRLDADPATVVLVAIYNGVIVGTNSWKPDTASGLHVDDDFPEEVAAVRAEGRNLGASWRIVTRPWCAGVPSIVMALIRRTTSDMVGAGIETSLFTFAARHEKFYRRVLKMRTIGRRVVNHELLGVDAVLMRLDREAIQWPC